MARKRRGNNEGSIHRRPDGRWEAKISLPSGDRLSFYGRTAEEAHQKLTVALFERQGGGDTDGPGGMKLGEFLDTWLERTAKGRIRAHTYKGYEVNVRVHLKPALGHWPLNRLEPMHVQDLIDEKLRQGLSPTSIRYMHGILRNALNHAVRWNYVQRNPAALVDGPRVERQEIQPFTRDDAQRFLQAIKGDRLEALYTVALTMGLRQGEALGLRWRDVDLDMGYIRVTRQLQRINHKYELVELKTARSRRTLAVPAAIVAGLHRHKARQTGEHDAAGRRWHDTDLVFCRPNGYPLSGSVITHRFQDLLARAGLERRRFHDLRHSCATLLLAQGVPARVVMEVLGHSQISLTLNTYTHVLPELKREAADRMNDLLRDG
jgi:integrase